MDGQGKFKYIDNVGHCIPVTGKISIPDENVKGLSVSGKVYFKNLDLNKGNFKGKIKGINLRGKSIVINGNIDLCEIQAGQLNICFSEISQINKIQANYVSVLPDESVLPEKMVSLVEKVIGLKVEGKRIENIILTVDDIEGDTVIIKNCHVHTIRCRMCKILEGCTVDMVFYKEKLDVHLDSFVNQQIKQ